jgi:hypothetical protein
MVFTSEADRAAAWMDGSGPEAAERSCLAFSRSNCCVEKDIDGTGAKASDVRTNMLNTHIILWNMTFLSNFHKGTHW